MGNLAETLAVAVPLHIKELEEQGGPTSEDFKNFKNIAEILGTRGEALLFGSKKKGESADQFNMVAKSLAILSFVPGGVKLFGSHWETKIEKGKTK